MSSTIVATSKPADKQPGRLKNTDKRLWARRWRTQSARFLAAHSDPDTYKRALDDPHLRDRRLSLAALQTVIERSVIAMPVVDDFLAVKHASLILRCVRQREIILDSMQRDYGDIGAIPRSALIRWLDDLTLLLAANPDQSPKQSVETVRQAAAVFDRIELRETRIAKGHVRFAEVTPHAWAQRIAPGGIMETV